jgi:hypothetical protein
VSGGFQHHHVATASATRTASSLFMALPQPVYDPLVCLPELPKPIDHVARFICGTVAKPLSIHHYRVFLRVDKASNISEVELDDPHCRLFGCDRLTLIRRRFLPDAELLLNLRGWLSHGASNRLIIDTDTA